MASTVKTQQAYNVDRDATEENEQQKSMCLAQNEDIYLRFHRTEDVFVPFFRWRHEPKR
jgi:hypothetical protein